MFVGSQGLYSLLTVPAGVCYQITVELLPLTLLALLMLCSQDRGTLSGIKHHTLARASIEPQQARHVCVTQAQLLLLKVRQ